MCYVCTYIHTMYALVYIVYMYVFCIIGGKPEGAPH